MAQTDSGIYYPTSSSSFPIEDIFKALSDSVEDLIGGAWTTFTPTWVGNTTNPSLGNGTLSGRYRRIGFQIDVQIDLTAGSTTTFGSGGWSFGLPVNSRSGIRPVGAAYARDSSAANPYYTISAVATGTSLVPLGGSGNSQISSSAPFTWASGDELHMSIRYEAAS